MQLAVYSQDDEAQDFRLLCKVDNTARSIKVKNIIRLFGLLLFSRILTGDGYIRLTWAAAEHELQFLIIEKNPNHYYAKS